MKKIDPRQVAVAFMVMADRPVEPLELGHLHGLSSEMYKNDHLFQYAAKALSSGQILNLSISGGDGRKTGGTIPKESWIGQNEILEELERVGIPLNKVIISKPITNSKEEAVAILEICQKMGFRSVGSITTYYHGGRMPYYMVKAMRERELAGSPTFIDYRMLVSPINKPFAEMLGSQGVKKTTGFQASIDDALKIEEHMAAGFAAKFEEVVHYYENRERIIKNQKW